MQKETLGTQYGGWCVPKNMTLNENSIVYSGGVGEDVSFDVLLQNKYNCNIYLIDPTERAINHFDEYKKYYNNKDTFTGFSGDIQKDYLSTINNVSVNLDKFFYINLGLWSEEKNDVLFYKPKNRNHVSHTLVENMYSSESEKVDIDTIKNIMTKNGHTHIDLLKIDIEGAEIEVLNNMLDDEIYPKYLCVEFDLYLKKKDPNGLTQKVIEKLKQYYNVVENSHWNITFEIK
jgi:FkbM family methyltransferase